jgi:hypothetical protein
MSENASATLLSAPTNYAVVQLPNRQFPGIVFQGDSTYSIFTNLRRLQASGCIQDEDMSAELEDLVDLFREIVTSYENVLARHGIALPYAKGR